MNGKPWVTTATFMLLHRSSVTVSRPSTRLVAVISTEPSTVEDHTRPMAHRYLGQESGDAYINATGGEAGRGDSVVIRMRPERWLTTDYAKEFSPS